MNTHDIELPPLPRPRVPLIDADVDLMDIGRLANWCEKTAKDYARAAVEADRKQRFENGEALKRYKECEGDKESDPIERLRFFCSLAMSGKDWLDSEQFFEDLIADRQRRGEPVAWGAFYFGGKRSGKLYSHTETEAQIDAYIADVHRSDDSITLRKGPLYTTPQPAETGGTHTIHNDHSGSQNGNQNLQPDEPDLVKCAECGAEMIHVRPGKWQHPDCSQSHWAAEPVVTDAPVPSDDLQGLSDRAYCQYIEQMRRPECLGWEQKVKDGRFGEAELKAHTKAGEFLGRHHAFSEAAALLARYGKVVDESTHMWKRIEEYSREVDGKKIDIYLGDFLLYCPQLEDEDEENTGVVIGHYSEPYKGWYTSETLEKVFPTHFMPLPEKPRR